MDKIFLIARREVGTYFNSPVAYVVVILFLLITGALFWIPYFQEVSLLSLRAFFSQAPLFLVFFAPAITMGLLAGERRSGTLELLLTMPVGATQVVLGKFLGALFLLVVVFLMTLPYAFTLSLLGDLDWGAVFAGYLGLLLLGGAYAALGVMASAWTQDQVVAILIAFSLSFFLYFVDQLVVGQPSGGHAVLLEYLSTSYHFQSIARGVVDLRNIVYYLTVIGFSLSVAIFSIGASEWLGRKEAIKDHFQFGAKVLGALMLAILLNLGASQLLLRFDLTANRIYTLSEISVEAVRGVPEPVEVLVFLSPNLPPPFHTLHQQIEETLLEYKARSQGRLSFQILNPEESPELDGLARNYGIEEVAISQTGEREVSLRAVFKGVAFVMGEKSEVIENLQVSGRAALDDFEYEFTRALLQLQNREPRRLGVVIDDMGSSDELEFVELLQELAKVYYGGFIKVEPLRLAEMPSADHFHGVILISIENDLSPEALFGLDQYLQGGGRVAWFQSGWQPDRERFRRELQERIARDDYSFPEIYLEPLETNVIDFFAALGIRLNSDMVIDRERALSYGVIPTPTGPARVSHPATFPITDINPDLGFTRYFSMISLPAPTSLEWTTASQGEERVAVDVLRTPESSLRWPRPARRMSYQEVMREDIPVEQGSFLVAAMVEGILPSYYRDAPLPEGKRELDLIAEPRPGKVFVIGSSDFLFELPEAGYDQRLALVGMTFFLNSLEWLVEESSLSEIRTKAMPRFVADLPPEVQRSMRFINIFAVPALFASIGVFMMIRRRRRREYYSPDVSETGP